MLTYMRGRINNVSSLNNFGFTMLDMLYAFSIFLIIIAFIPLSFQFLFHNDRFDAKSQSMEWDVFLNQLKKEVRLSDNISVLNGRLLLRRNGQDVLYEKYRNSIRRRVNMAGHEVVLQQVNTVEFTKIKDGINITVEDVFNQSYTAKVYSYLQLDDSYGP